MSSKIPDLSQLLYHRPLVVANALGINLKELQSPGKTLTNEQIIEKCLEVLKGSLEIDLNKNAFTLDHIREVTKKEPLPRTASKIEGLNLLELQGLSE